MNEFIIETAKRDQAKLRIGLAAPSGAGKTFSALQMAYGMTHDWNKIIVVDTEQGSASLYANLGPYKVLKLTPPFNPERYIMALEMAEKAGFDVIIIDSISHAWIGKGGLLEEHEALGTRDSYFKMTKPRHRRIIERILQSTAHVIVTVRTKQGFSIAQDGDKSKVQKHGLDPITESNFDYEMTAYLDIGMNHMAEASKDRTGIFMKPGQLQHPQQITPETGEKLIKWAEEGVSEVAPPKPPEKPAIEAPKPPAATTPPPEKPKVPLITVPQMRYIQLLCAKKGKNYEVLKKHYKVEHFNELTFEQAAKSITQLEKLKDVQKTAPAKPVKTTKARLPMDENVNVEDIPF